MAVETGQLGVNFNFQFLGTVCETQWLRYTSSGSTMNQVTRVIQFGSEPLFDNVLSHDVLATEVAELKTELAHLHIPVTVSELAYGYQEREGSQDVINVIDSISIHMLPIFASTATTGMSLCLSATYLGSSC